VTLKKPESGETRLRFPAMILACQLAQGDGEEQEEEDSILMVTLRNGSFWRIPVREICSSGYAKDKVSAAPASLVTAATPVLFSFFLFLFFFLSVRLIGLKAQFFFFFFFL